MLSIICLLYLRTPRSSWILLLVSSALTKACFPTRSNWDLGEALGVKWHVSPHFVPGSWYSTWYSVFPSWLILSGSSPRRLHPEPIMQNSAGAPGAPSGSLLSQGTCSPVFSDCQRHLIVETFEFHVMYKQKIIQKSTGWFNTHWAGVTYIN